MFVTPQHQVKELRDEAGRNIVGGTMLCSELGRMDVGRYTEQRGEEMREEQQGEGGGEGGEERKGKRGKGDMHMLYICTTVYTYIIGVLNMYITHDSYFSFPLPLSHCREISCSSTSCKNFLIVPLLKKQCNYVCTTSALNTKI